MIITVDVPYDFGQILYLKTDSEQKPRMAIGVKYCADQGILIEVQCGTETTWHYPIEISTSKDVILSME